MSPVDNFDDGHNRLQEELNDTRGIIISSSYLSADDKFTEEDEEILAAFGNDEDSSEDDDISLQELDKNAEMLYFDYRLWLSNHYKLTDEDKEILAAFDNDEDVDGNRNSLEELNSDEMYFQSLPNDKATEDDECVQHEDYEEDSVSSGSSDDVGNNHHAETSSCQNWLKDAATKEDTETLVTFDNDQDSEGDNITLEKINYDETNIQNLPQGFELSKDDDEASILAAFDDDEDEDDMLTAPVLSILSRLSSSISRTNALVNCEGQEHEGIQQRFEKIMHGAVKREDLKLLYTIEEEEHN